MMMATFLSSCGWGSASTPGVSAHRSPTASPVSDRLSPNVALIHRRLTFPIIQPRMFCEWPAPRPLATELPTWSHDAVVLAQVTAFGPAIWATPDGRPPTQAEVDTGLAPMIYTQIHLRVLRTVEGALPTVNVYMRGGRIGDNSIAWCDLSAPLIPGNDLLLFIAADVNPPHHWTIEFSDAVHGSTVRTDYGEETLP